MKTLPSLSLFVLLSGTLFLASCDQPGTVIDKPDDDIVTADIELDEPEPNDIVSSPLEIRGEAVGSWYFEGSFPVRLLDSEGNEIVTGIAQAQDDWMTEEPVEFELFLTFVTDSQTGSLVLEKDNPSGLPENAASIVVPLQFE